MGERRTSLTYLLYHGRWQLSTVVMTGPMWLFNEQFGWPGWMALPVVQFFGAIVFWYVDKWLFTGGDSES